jgi:hypothetical protein
MQLKIVSHEGVDLGTEIVKVNRIEVLDGNPSQGFRKVFMTHLEFMIFKSKQIINT